jgi:hypothetical protein
MSRHLSRLALLACFLFSTATTLAADLAVPQQYGTIQAAIDAAQSGDTVLVAPGTYFENLSIAKSLNLRSTSGASETIIDGQRTRAVIDARGTGTERITISGFTITNGRLDFPFQLGGGVVLASVIAAVSDNVIIGNIGCYGSGISTTTAAVTIERNRIADNPQDAACGGNGGGIFLNVDGAGPSLVANNIISGHSVAGVGGGIAVNALNQLTIRENLIKDNEATNVVGGTPYGGGLFVGISSAVVTGNVLFNNTAGEGGAMALFPIDNANRMMVRSNVMGQNHASIEGSAVLVVTVSQQGLQMVQNVIEGNSATALVRCEGTEFQVSPSNRLRNDGGPFLSGNCVSPPRNTP